MLLEGMMAQITLYNMNTRPVQAMRVASRYIEMTYFNQVSR